MAQSLLARTRARRGEDGWTLLELMVVVALIMILATMALVQYRNSVTSAKEATLRGQLFVMKAARLMGRSTGTGR